jgi:hypothetical protein
MRTPEVDPHHERRWLILLLVLITQVMILIDATVINVALRSCAQPSSDPTPR